MARILTVDAYGRTIGNLIEPSLQGTKTDVRKQTNFCHVWMNRQTFDSHMMIHERVYCISWNFLIKSRAGFLSWKSGFDTSTHLSSTSSHQNMEKISVYDIEIDSLQTKQDKEDWTQSRSVHLPVVIYV